LYELNSYRHIYDWLFHVPYPTSLKKYVMKRYEHVINIIIVVHLDIIKEIINDMKTTLIPHYWKYELLWFEYSSSQEASNHVSLWIIFNKWIERKITINHPQKQNVFIYSWRLLQGHVSPVEQLLSIFKSDCRSSIVKSITNKMIKIQEFYGYDVLRYYVRSWMFIRLIMLIQRWICSEYTELQYWCYRVIIFPNDVRLRILRVIIIFHSFRIR
jgi:hypothetical protein